MLAGRPAIQILALSRLPQPDRGQPLHHQALQPPKGVCRYHSNEWPRRLSTSPVRLANPSILPAPAALNWLSERPSAVSSIHAPYCPEPPLVTPRYALLPQPCLPFQMTGDELLQFRQAPQAHQAQVGSAVRAPPKRLQIRPRFATSAPRFRFAVHPVPHCACSTPWQDPPRPAPMRPIYPDAPDQYRTRLRPALQISAE